MILTASAARVSSTTTSAVMIFVRLAIGRTRSGRRRHSTSPVSRSNTRPARGGFRRRTWTASTPPSGIEGTGSPSINGAGSRGSSGTARADGVPTASANAGAPPESSAATNVT